MPEYYALIAIVTATIIQGIYLYIEEDISLGAVLGIGLVWPAFWSYVIARFIMDYFSNSRGS